jgi:hypothetical protein
MTPAATLRPALLALLAALCAACASTPQAPPPRQASLAQLVRAYDVDSMVNRSQAESLAEAHRAIDKARSGYGEALNRLSSEQRTRFEAATDRFVSASRTAPDTTQADTVWAQAYAEGLSDAELGKIAEFAGTDAGAEFFANGGNPQGLSGDDIKAVLKFSRTPAGQKQPAANVAAASALRTWLAQQRSTSIDLAVQRYLGELHTILGY